MSSTTDSRPVYGAPLDDEPIWAPGAPTHRPATADEDSIPVPGGYPMDRWSTDGDADWPFAVDPDLRQHYASIPTGDPRLTLNPRDREPFAFAEHVRGRRWAKHVIDQWPQVFRITERPHHEQSGQVLPIGDTWALHHARLKLATELYNQDVQRRHDEQRKAKQRPCPACGQNYLPNSARVTRLCQSCDRVHAGIVRTFGPTALDTIDGRTRLALVLGHMASLAAVADVADVADLR